MTTLVPGVGFALGGASEMTDYENLMDLSDHCERVALVSDDPDLRAFWHNASVGFKRKALSLPAAGGEAVPREGRGAGTALATATGLLAGVIVGAMLIASALWR